MNTLTEAQAVRIANQEAAKQESGPGRLVCKTDQTWKEDGVWWVELNVTHVDRHRHIIPTSVNYGDPARMIGVGSQGKVVSYEETD